MNRKLTRQSLPSKAYIELVGTAICVFNSNNGFIIENIINTDESYNWHDLIEKTSGQLYEPIEKTISKIFNNEIAILFEKIVNKRNRIIHSFRITSPEDEQVLATKESKRQDENQTQYIITEKFLLEFIKENESLSILLNSFRENFKKTKEN